MRSEEIRKEMNREQNIAFCRMLFPPTKGQFSFKKKKKSTQKRHWLFVQITDEPLAKSHLGLRLRTRICSWSAEGCEFTRGEQGEEGWGSGEGELPEFLAEVYQDKKIRRNV